MQWRTRHASARSLQGGRSAKSNREAERRCVVAASSAARVVVRRVLPRKPLASAVLGHGGGGRPQEVVARQLLLRRQRQRPPADGWRAVSVYPRPERLAQPLRARAPRLAAAASAGARALWESAHQPRPSLPRCTERQPWQRCRRLLAASAASRSLRCRGPAPHQRPCGGCARPTSHRRVCCASPRVGAHSVQSANAHPPLRPPPGRRSAAAPGRRATLSPSTRPAGRAATCRFCFSSPASGGA